jgi:hypothetical protein
MNFRIVNGDVDSINEIYPDFKKEFLKKENTIEDLRVKFDLSYKEYERLRSKVLSETGLKQKPQQKSTNARLINDTTYIYKIKGKYHVIKTINQKQTTYGRYDDFDSAKRVRDKLIENEWDRGTLREIEKECGV